MALTSLASGTLGYEAESTLSVDDPTPFLRSTLYRLTGTTRLGGPEI